MKKYEFVSEEEYQPVQDALIQLIKRVRKEVKDCFNFKYYFVGSARWGVITREVRGNRGYDFDLDFKVNCEDEYPAERIKSILMDAFRKHGASFGYKNPENSTSVITIKHVYDSRIVYSCDIAVVNEYKDEHGDIRTRNICLDKTSGTYIWNIRSKGYDHQKEKVDKIKNAGRWEELKKTYLWKKNNNTEGKESRALFAEAVNETIQKERNMGKGHGVSGHTHTQQPLDHYANQHNPNNSAYWADMNNHANQLNPNNDLYQGGDEKVIRRDNCIIKIVKVGK